MLPPPPVVSAITVIDFMYARFADVETVIVVVFATAVSAVNVKFPVDAGGLWALPIAVEPAVTLNVPVSELYCLAFTTTDFTLAAEDNSMVILPADLLAPNFIPVVPAYTFEPLYDDIPVDELTLFAIELFISELPSEFASLNVTEATVFSAIFALLGAEGLVLPYTAYSVEADETLVV